MEPTTPSLPDDDVAAIDRLGAIYKELSAELSKIIIGQQRVVELLSIALFSRGHALLMGVPGLAKTLLISSVAKTLDLSFNRIQFTPDLMPADITGTDIIQDDSAGGKRQFEFIKGPVFANIVLADEINRATPKTQSALLEAMQEHTVTGGSQTYRLEEPFFVLATQNPLETEGTYPLPEAQMDRFLFKLDVAFPNKEELMKIVLTTTDGKVHRASKVMDGKRLLQMREIAQQVPVAEPVAEYLMDLILKTHPENPEAPEVVRQYVRYGASPRGAQAVLQAARIFALLAGRYHVAYEDIKQAAKPALRHRIFLNFEGMAEGKTSDEIIEALY